MTTIADMLKTYNARADKPLKAWKESKAKLQARIDALPAPAAKKAPEGTTTLVAIATELGISPKVARNKIRRRIAAGRCPIERAKLGSRWHMTPDVAKIVRAELAA